jgi:hypothetical protein
MANENKIPVVIRTQVYLNDPEYFCNKSWTLSFNLNTKSWISFHSYIPNFYIGENNFFYSGKNGCCDTDEFKVIAGTIDPVIPTTTTTTTFYPSPTTTTTTTTLNCLLSGQVILTDCILEGDGIITVPPTTTTTMCHRPSNLLSDFLFVQGYTLGTDPEVIFTDSLIDACSAIPDIEYVISLSNTDDSTLNTFNGQANTTSEVLQLGNIVYYGYGTDCTFVPNGWYFAYSGTVLEYVYHIESGVIIEITNCNPVTTTTTTTLICTEYELQNGAQADAVYSYTNCQGFFISNFLGEFEATIICAATNTVSADQIISITPGGPC